MSDKPSNQEELKAVLKTAPKINIFSKMLNPKDKTVDTKSWTAKFLVLTLLVWLGYYWFLSSPDDQRLNEFLDDTIKGTSEIQESIEKKSNEE